MKIFEKIILVVMMIALMSVFQGGSVSAETDSTRGTVDLNVKIGNAISVTYDKEVPNSLLANYTKLIYNYLKIIIATLASLMIVVGGVEWAMSGGNPEKVNSGKEKIFSALGGLAIFIIAGLILNAINPEVFTFT